jgi:protein-disulfide isomerase
MKKIMIVMIIGSIMTGCASSENQIREAVRKNPKIIFDTIEENPEQFIEVVNRAAQKAQQKQYEKQIADLKTEQENDLKSPKKPQLSADRRLAGTDDGKIVVVEYADFQCPACRMAYDSLKQFKEKHKGQIQFYYKNMPLDFHKMAMPSALYFEAIRLQDKSKALKFYDYVFENQSQLSDEGFLKKAAAVVGANLKKLEADIKSDAVKRTIEWDMSEFQKFGFTGTPVVLINGVALNGAQKIEELERVAQLTLEKSK